MQFTVSNLSANVAEEYVFGALKSMLRGKLPIFVCVGTDGVSGDCLGPLSGALLEKRLSGKTYVFGTLENPITALNANAAALFIKKVYSSGVIVAVDAALGSDDEIGHIKLVDKPLKPGLGVKKELDEIGDISIIGVVNGRGDSLKKLQSVRFSLVYRMATAIVGGAERYFARFKTDKPNVNSIV